MTTAKKRIYGLVTAVVFALTLLPLSGLFDRAGAAAAGTEETSVTFELKGSGTDGDPYQITSIDDLKQMRDAVNNKLTPEGDGKQPAVSAHYKLTADIESLTDWTPIGSLSVSFTGTFDGKGHKISGLSVKGGEPDKRAYDKALFAQIGEGGTVKNLIVEGTSNISSGWFVGLIAGANKGTIENCYAKGSVGGSYAVGGIVGYNNGTIKNCFANVTSTSTASSGSFGAIAGTNGNNAITNSCYKAGSLPAVGAATGDTAKTIVALKDEEVAKGKAAWILRQGQSGDMYWGQDLPTDTEPKLYSDDNNRVYRAEFVLKTGTDNVVVAEEFANKDGKFNVPEVSYDKDGQTASDDWFTETGLENKYDFDTPVSTDITLYNGGSLKDYTITLDANGGTIEDENWVKGDDGYYTHTYNKETPAFDLPTPTAPKDQKFAGWEQNGVSGEQAKVTIDKGSVGNKAYTAKYTNAIGPVITATLGEHSWSSMSTDDTEVYVKDPTVTVTATVTDEQDKDLNTIYYLISDKVLTAETLKGYERQYWLQYSNGVSVSPVNKNNKVYVYFKATDKDKNVTCVSTAAIVFDLSAPTISGITNGATYCESIEFTVNDANLLQVQVGDQTLYDALAVAASDDVVAAAVGDNKFTAKFDHEGSKEVAITARDKAGNETVYNVTINGQHTKGMTVTQMRRAASCVNIGEGIKLTYCKVCNSIIERDDNYKEPMREHSWSTWKVVSSVTCGDTTRERKCQFCGLTETETTGGTHEWEDDYTIDVQPTCLKPGQKSVHCKNCHISDPDRTEVIPTLAHQAGEVETKITQPTCTEEGLEATTIYCANCMVEMGTTYTTLPAKGHEFAEWEVVETNNPESTTLKHECTVCGYSETKTEEKDHDWDTQWTIDKEPTCTTDGSKSHHCKNGCGSTKDSETIPATGHKALEPVKESVIEANCTTAGRYYDVVYCETCKAVISSTPVTVPALGHKMGAWEEVKAADGKSNEQRKCSVCGITEVRGTDLENHKWNTEYTIDVEPTCTDDGSKSIHCSVCGLTKPDSSQTIPALGHTWGEWKTISSPDCDDEGTREHECTVCHTIEAEGLNATGHSWNEEYTIDQEATCTTDGSKSIHCTKCDAVKDSEVIPAKGHSFGEWEEVKTADGKSNYQRKCTVCGTTETKGMDLENHKWNTEYTIDVEPTCTTEGSKSIHCSVCGLTKPGSSETIKANDHTWGDWKEISSPDCDDSGAQERECTVCHTKETKNLSPNGHTWNEDYTIDKEATCTTDGSRSIHCSKCDAVDKSEVIPAKGHDFGEWEEVVSQSTGEVNEERKCKVCGFTETRGADLVNHKWNTEYTIDVEPTCTTEGSKSIHCSVCGLTKDSEVIPALGHTWGEWREISSPDCDDEGTQERECSVCGLKETNGLAANGHTWEDKYTVDKEATCLVDGSESIHCSKCDAVKDSRAIPAPGHHTPAAERQGAKAATPTEDGYTGDVVCEVCEEVIEKGEVIPATKGTIDVVPETGEGAPALTLTETSKIDLEDAALTDEEKEALNNGADIEIIISVEDADETVTDDDKALTDKAVSGKYTVGQFINIDITKIIDGEEYAVTQLGKEISLTIAVPDDLKADGRTFSIVRLHDGEADILSDLDSDANTITFKTDKFSVYAIVYTDKASEPTPPAITEPDNTEPDNSKPDDSKPDESKPDSSLNDDSPATGSDFPLIFVILAAAVLGAVCVIRKENDAR